MATTNQTEIFPEPRAVPQRSSRRDRPRRTYVQPIFPWQINEDGTGEETMNHVGRHELGGSYANAAYTNDPNIQDLYYFGNQLQHEHH